MVEFDPQMSLKTTERGVSLSEKVPVNGSLWSFPRQQALHVSRVWLLVERYFVFTTDRVC
jgi:hypothetical protein